MKDKKILLYAGTTEGRKLASYLGRRGVRLHVCVATAYGESLLPEEKNITVHTTGWTVGRWASL